MSKANAGGSVYSLHVDELTGDTREVLETRRTDLNVAYDDAQLIRSILHRKAWVVEERP